MPQQRSGLVDLHPDLSSKTQDVSELAIVNTFNVNKLEEMKIYIKRKKMHDENQTSSAVKIQVDGEASQRARHSWWVSDRFTLTLWDVNEKFLLILGSIKCTANVCRKSNVNRKTARKMSQLIKISYFLSKAEMRRFHCFTSMHKGNTDKSFPWRCHTSPLARFIRMLQRWL